MKRGNVGQVGGKFLVGCFGTGLYYPLNETINFESQFTIVLDPTLGHPKKKRS